MFIHLPPLLDIFYEEKQVDKLVYYGQKNSSRSLLVPSMEKK